MDSVEWLIMFLGVVLIFVLGQCNTPNIKCKGTPTPTAEYLHTRMCETNEWKDCQPWVREEPTIKERYMNLAKDVCK